MILPPCPTCRCSCGLLALKPQDIECGEIHSRITELAACNDAPPDLDKQFCKSKLHDLQEDLQTLDDHIESLKRLLSALKAVRKKKSRLTRSCRRILNPFRSLPTEILSQILSNAYPSVDPVTIVQEHLDYSSLDTDQAPWTLTRVCTRWRQTVLSTPRLWSRIGITVNNWNHINSLNLLRIQLQLSKSSPLIVAIAWQHDDDLPQTEMLFPSSLRWETLVLSPGLEPQFRPLDGKLPSLRNLFYGYGLRWNVPVATSTFPAAPKLRTLCVPKMDHLTGLSHLPLSQITTFSAICLWGASEPSDVVHLASLTALQQCSLDVNSGRFGTDSAVFNPLLLPNLRILRVDFGPFRDGNLACIFGKLTLPALEVLTIEGENLRTLASLAALVQRSQCILKELHLGNDIYIDTDIDIDIIGGITIAFEKSPSLKRLTLDHRIVAVLASRIDLLPSLQVLHVTLIRRWQLEPDLYLLQFVKDAHPELVVTCEVRNSL